MSTMNLTLKIWRQPSADAAGKMNTYELGGVTEHMSFLEMLDVLNEKLIKEGKDPVEFDYDCRRHLWHLWFGDQRRRSRPP